VATDLVRDPTADLFGESPLQALHGLHENPEFGLGDVPSQVVEEALSAGCEVEGPHKIAWRFSVLTTKAAMRVLSNALKNSRDVGERVLDRAATVIVLWWDETAGGPDADRLEPESNLWILRGGRLVQNVMLAVHAQGYVAGWDSAVAALPQATRAALGAPEHWIPFGAVAIGPPPSRSLAPRSPPDWRSVTSWSEPET
jgi:nitroreductase